MYFGSCKFFVFAYYCKLVAANTGSKRTDETKAKMSAWQKGLSLEERWGEEKAIIVKEKYSKAKKGKTYEEMYGEDADKMRALRTEQFRKPRKRVDCEICGKDVTTHTLKRHQNGRNCKDNLERKELNEYR